MTLKLLFLPFLFLCTISGFTQSPFGVNQEEPVQTKLTQEINDDGTLSIKVCFDVEDNWMVYDSLIGGDGPIPLTFEFEEKSNVKKLKVNKPKLKQKEDDVFGIDIDYFDSDVCYDITISKTVANQTTQITISYQYMCCNLVTGVCLPPVYKTETIVWKK